MGAGKIIKQLLLERNMSVKDLAEKMNIIPQSMSNKIYRDTFSYEEVVKIADILGCDVKIITRDTKKEFM
ncbi:helix-turn-helix transcriptional regulator [Treponema sp. OMZ 788]|uniref:helix-turn-helix domain-containing protein n=1 Tax=Treponema sp. OMZ 788 TaxID=2563664 RepID=UPI0020A430D4|nr:helix-turn-helix transcriptional regulator [Treponema sp. OMZ 788]UTC65239.1 helix-turn-helix transcriptional regulator [Treponema sp. OMZ 788]